MHPLHHHLITYQLSDLRPTQAAIGMHEVEQKRLEWKALKKADKKNLIESHWFPSVIGPGGIYFIVDHHHLGRALHLEGQETVRLTVLKDLYYEITFLLTACNTNDAASVKFCELPHHATHRTTSSRNSDGLTCFRLNNFIQTVPSGHTRHTH